ncbi:hypothetical protein ABPG72_005944 [Tetrahymena utriculariae]
MQNFEISQELFQPQTCERDSVYNFRNQQTDCAKSLQFYDKGSSHQNIFSSTQDQNTTQCASNQVSSQDTKVTNVSNSDQNKSEQYHSQIEEEEEEDEFKEALNDVDKIEVHLEKLNDDHQLKYPQQAYEHLQEANKHFSKVLQLVDQHLKNSNDTNKLWFKVAIAFSNIRFFLNHTQKNLIKSNKKCKFQRISYCLCGKYYTSKRSDSSLQNHFKQHLNNQNEQYDTYKDYLNIYQPFDGYTGCKSSVKNYFEWFKLYFKTFFNSNVLQQIPNQMKIKTKTSGLELVEYLLSKQEEFQLDFEELEEQLKQIINILKSKETQIFKLQSNNQRRKNKRSSPYQDENENASNGEKIKKNIKREYSPSCQNSQQIINQQIESNNHSDMITNIKRDPYHHINEQNLFSSEEQQYQYLPQNRDTHMCLKDNYSQDISMRMTNAADTLSSQDVNTLHLKGVGVYLLNCSVKGVKSYIYYQPYQGDKELIRFDEQKVEQLIFPTASIKNKPLLFVLAAIYQDNYPKLNWKYEVSEQNQLGTMNDVFLLNEHYLPYDKDSNIRIMRFNNYDIPGMVYDLKNFQPQYDEKLLIPLYLGELYDDFSEIIKQLAIDTKKQKLIILKFLDHSRWEIDIFYKGKHFSSNTHEINRTKIEKDQKLQFGIFLWQDGKEDKTPRMIEQNLYDLKLTPSLSSSLQLKHLNGDKLFMSEVAFVWKKKNILENLSYQQQDISMSMINVTDARVYSDSNTLTDALVSSNSNTLTDALVSSNSNTLHLKGVGYYLLNCSMVKFDEQKAEQLIFPTTCIKNKPLLFVLAAIYQDSYPKLDWKYEVSEQNQLGTMSDVFLLNEYYLPYDKNSNLRIMRFNNDNIHEMAENLNNHYPQYDEKLLIPLYLGQLYDDYTEIVQKLAIDTKKQKLIILKFLDYTRWEIDIFYKGKHFSSNTHEMKRTKIEKDQKLQFGIFLWQDGKEDKTPRMIEQNLYDLKLTPSLSSSLQLKHLNGDKLFISEAAFAWKEQKILEKLSYQEK